MPTTNAIREAMATVRKGPDSPADALYVDACELLAREFVGLTSAGELVRVKGLEWECFFPDDPESQHFARTIFGMYRATYYEWSFKGKTKTTGSIEESKAQAEANYRERLAAAMEPLYAKGGE